MNKLKKCIIAFCVISCVFVISCVSVFADPIDTTSLSYTYVPVDSLNSTNLSFEKHSSSFSDSFIGTFYFADEPTAVLYITNNKFTLYSLSSNTSQTWDNDFSTAGTNYYFNGSPVMFQKFVIGSIPSSISLPSNISSLPSSVPDGIWIYSSVNYTRTRITVDDFVSTSPSDPGSDSNLIGDLGSVFTSTLGWISSIVDVIIDTPILLLTVGFLCLGGIIGLFGRVLGRS